MKANELRIGNIVKCFGVREIIELSKRECRFSDDDGASIRTIEPLQLTELTEGYMKRFNNIIESCGLSLEKYTEGDFVLKSQYIGSEYSIRVKYVHKLQNLLYELEGVELV